MNNQLTIKQYLESDNVKTRIQQVLEGRAQQFIVSLLSTVNASPALAKCTPQSVYTAAMTAASLDLPINQNLGLAYIIPYGNEAQFQIGAKGFKQLAMKSHMYRTINDSDVREGEYQGINRVTGELDFTWVEDEVERDKLPIVGYLAYFKLKDGYEKSRYMTIGRLKEHGLKYSQLFKKGKGGWVDDFDSMARKTVIKLLLSKDGLLSTDMQTAIQADQTVIDENGYKYVDNKKLLPDEIAEQKERDRVRNHITNAKSTEELELCLTALEDFMNAELNEAYDAKKKELGGKSE